MRVHQDRIPGRRKVRFRPFAFTEHGGVQGLTGREQGWGLSAIAGSDSADDPNLREYGGYDCNEMMTPAGWHTVSSGVHVVALAPPVAVTHQSRQTMRMASAKIPVDALSADERIELMGRLWDSLDPAAAAPITPALAAELARREAEADAEPEAGVEWSNIRTELRKKLP